MELCGWGCEAKPALIHSFAPRNSGTTHVETESTRPVGNFLSAWIVRQVLAVSGIDQHFAITDGAAGKADFVAVVSDGAPRGDIGFVGLVLTAVVAVKVVDHLVLLGVDADTARPEAPVFAFSEHWPCLFVF